MTHNLRALPCRSDLGRLLVPVGAAGMTAQKEMLRDRPDAGPGRQRGERQAPPGSQRTGWGAAQPARGGRRSSGELALAGAGCSYVHTAQQHRGSW